MAKTIEYQFDFCVSGIDEDKVAHLMERIVELVEQYGGEVGGGFALVQEEGNGEQECP